jgi:hypothetical protein
MRFVLAMVFAGLAALPLGASAQPAEEDSLSSWQVDEGASLEQPAPEKPALELKLDEAGVWVMPGPALLTVDGYTLEEMNVRVKRARIGFLVSAGVCDAGAVLLMVAAAAGLATWEPLGGPPTSGGRYTTNDRALIAGAVLASSGAVGMITAGGIWGHRKRQRRELVWNASDSTAPRRVQWDLARSRLVF